MTRSEKISQTSMKRYACHPQMKQQKQGYDSWLLRMLKEFSNVSVTTKWQLRK